MSFVDDALPAAKPARLSVAAVKGRHGDSDNGTAFRKAFADMGSSPISRMLDAKESGKTAVADDAEQDMPKTIDGDANAENPVKADVDAKAETLSRLRLSSAVAGRSSAAPSSEPNARETLQQDEPAPDTRPAKPQIRLAGRTADDLSPDLKKPDLSGKAHAPSSVARTVDRNGTATASTTADIPVELTPHADETDLALDVRELRLSLRPGRGVAGSTASATEIPLAEASSTMPAGTSAMAALKASLARKAVLADDQDASTSPTVRQSQSGVLPAATDKVSAQSKAAHPDAVPAMALEDDTPLASLETVPEQPKGFKTRAIRVDAALVDRAGPGSSAKSTGVTTADPDMTTTEAASSRSAQASMSATARHVTATPLLSVASEPPATDDEQVSVTAAAQETTTDVRQLLALLGQPAAAQTMSQIAAAGDDKTMDLGALAARASGDRLAGPAAPSTSTPVGDAPSATDRKDGADQLFRFARADGKGGAVSMNVDTDGQKTIAAVTDANAARGDTVTVLDARRYLGIAPTLSAAMPVSVNAQAVTSAIAGSLPLDPNAASLAAQPAGAAGKVVNTLKIQMHPIDLGLVTATLRLRDDELQVELKVQTGEAYRQLTDDQDSMIKALRAQGFAVDQVNIVFTPSDSGTSRDAAQQQVSGGQQQPAPGGRDGQAGLGAESGREQRNNGSGERNAGDRRTGHDSTRETSPASQSGISDDLYL